MTRPEVESAGPGGASDGAASDGAASDGAAAGAAVGVAAFNAAAKERLLVALCGLTSLALTNACAGEIQAVRADLSSKATSLTSADVRNPAGIS